MENHNKPRHIRDIAHLYLSRLPAKGKSRRSVIYVAAASGDCFGAYHAANIALCCQQQGHRVRLFELSGQLPCCGYFLRLPPSVYIKQKKEFPREELSALGGISISFSVPDPAGDTRGPAQGVAAGFRRSSGSGLDIVHLPPAASREAAEQALRSAEFLHEGVAPLSVRAVVLAMDDHAASVAGGRLFGKRNSIDWVILSLNRNRPGGANTGVFRQSLGYLAGWRPLLADPLPCVVRDPESHVSRSYFSISEALQTPSGATRERYDTTKPQPPKSVGRFR
jgi:hypothetical protein